MKKLLLFGSFFLLSFVTGLFGIMRNAQADGYSYTVSVICNDGGKIECTGDTLCTRSSSQGWVCCDGVYTYC